LSSDAGGQGHWTGEKADPYHYFGFIYAITHLLSGRIYLGKKQYYNSKREYGCSRRCTDRQSKDFKLKCWKESNWRVYKGSSPSLKKFMEEVDDDSQFEYKIICQCRSKSLLHYMELKILWTADVMRERMEDGVTFRYFNNSIGSIKFKVTESIS
jgi:hypothetical protein